MLETAGTIDLDVEMKFQIGSQPFSIDVHKKHLEELKDLYKTLVKIEEIANDPDAYIDFAMQSPQMSPSVFTKTISPSKEMNEISFIG